MKKATYEDLYNIPDNMIGVIQVPHVWLIDPNSRTLEVFRLESGKWVWISAHAEDEKVRVEPFQAIELDLALLWE